MTKPVREFFNDEIGTELPIAWRSAFTDELLDVFGHTLELTIARPKSTVVVTKTTGVEGGDGSTSPNISVTWEPGDLTDLEGIHWISIKDEDTDQTIENIPVRFKTRPV